MIRKSISLLITESDDNFIKNFINQDPIINSYPKFISWALHQFIISIKNNEIHDNYSDLNNKKNPD